MIEIMIRQHEKKFQQIDALRFFAVFPVLVAHWGTFDLTDRMSFFWGSNGVNLFFAISGFLITLGLIKSNESDQTAKTSLYKFYVRRFLRIFPIYYLLLIFLWFFKHQDVIGGLWWYLTYTTNFYCIKTQSWGIAHLWSLSVEEQFYWVWPFVILFMPSRILPFFICLLIACSIIFKAYIIHVGSPWWIFYMNPIGVLDILGLGGLLSLGYFYYPNKLKSLLYNKIVIAIIIVQLVVVIYSRLSGHADFIYDVFNRFSFGLFCIWLIGRAVFGFKGMIGFILNLRPLKYIGKISYGVYLVHIFIPEMAYKIQYPTNHVLRSVFYFIITIMICSISWYFFESRILRLKEKFE
jgi:peptidoglycan/LPS O-acetylase OafA/YrhL